MKKLSLLLFAFCLSHAAWAGVDDWTHLNPFAYDLKSEVIENGTQLKLTYSLNATAVTSDTYNEDHHGLQIYLIDENGNRIKKEDGTTWTCTSGSYQKGKDHSVIIPIADLPPAAKETNLSWEVVVHGNKNWTKPKAITSYLASQTATYKPRAGHGIAIEKDPNSKWFGRIYVAEACTNTSGKNSVLEYDMLFNYKTYHHKDKLDGGSSHFSSSVNYEPHRLKISKDGRMFATCYHPNAISAVLEYIGNGEWRTVVKADEGKNDDADGSQSLYPINDIYDCRPIAMDVKGSEDDLKIIVAWIKPKGRKAQNQWDSKIEIYEYNVGSNEATIQSNKGLDQDAGTLVGTYIESNTATNVTTLPNTCGLLFQAFFHTNDATPWVTEEHGLIDILYGEGADNPIWMKIDFACGSGDDRRRGQILYFNDSKKTFDYLTEKTTKYIYRMPNTVNTYCNYDGSYGGNAFYIKGDTLLTASGANTLLVYTGVKSKSLQYQTSISTGASPGIGAWTTGFAEDYAGNLYALSEEADNIVAFAMPYNGTRTTRANSTFTVSDPVPNILATDLRYEVNNANEYIFSFNTNTQPEYAELRFYKSYESMKQSLAAVNADDFDGDMNVGHNDENLVCYYPITKGLKQGKISVTLGGVGGTIENKVITNDRLPAGELYWSVYVQTRKSSVFAPIYKQGTTGEDAHYRLHATVNNYPETDGFGHIYAAQYNGTTGKKSLMIYNFNANGNSNDNQGNISNSTRYKLLNEYVNHTGSKPKFENQRRLAVAPDGKVYISDHGLSDYTQYSTQAWADRPMLFTNGGIWVWDSKSQTEDYVQISMFLNDKTESSSGLAIYDHGNQVKLYGMNTYGEFADHTGGYKWKGLEYTEANQANISVYGWNGFKEYNLGAKENILYQETAGTTQHPLGMGDGNGNISIVAMDKGVWMAQHRLNDVQYTIDVFNANNSKKPALPDNTENYILSFVPYGSNTRTWKSCTDKGINYSGSSYTQDGASELTQLTTSPLQSCPGAGLAYRKTTTGKESLYIVNHQGDIVELQITSWSGTTPSVKYIKTWPGSGNKGQNDGKRTQGIITTMNFDYAGNLITTSGAGYTDNSQDIIVYTMPYDRTNAREIQAPNSCRMIPERLAYLDMSAQELELVINNHKDHDGCAIELFRPLQAGMFNTICLPFELDFANLPDEHPFKDAEVKAFTGVVLEDVGGEKVLSLVFSDITQGSQKIMSANVPYLLEPVEDIVGSVRFDNPVRLTSIEGGIVSHDVDDNRIDFKGVVPITTLEATYADDGTPLILLLVADNRLAALTSSANIPGFRAYFQLAKPLPAGTSAKIVGKKPTTTNTTIIVDGKKVNVEKFLREGRVYIRVGETLYTIDGQKVE